MKNILIKLAQELNIDISNVEAAVKLIDEGNTVPFIARYRKEVTGGLSDEQLRNLAERLDYLRNLENRKNEIIRLLEEMGKLSDEIKKASKKLKHSGRQKTYTGPLSQSVEPVQVLPGKGVLNH